MRAAFRKGRTLRLRDIQLPALETGQIRLQVEACGVCGTDVHSASEDEEQFGHEVAGTVLETGAGVTGFEVGQRVVLDSATPCGRCNACRNGVQELCTDIQSIWFVPSFGFAEEMIAPAICAIAYEGLAPEVASLQEPLGVALDLVRLADITPESNVLIMAQGRDLSSRHPSYRLVRCRLWWPSVRGLIFLDELTQCIDRTHKVSGVLALAVVSPVYAHQPPFVVEDPASACTPQGYIPGLATRNRRSYVQRAIAKNEYSCVDTYHAAAAEQWLGIRCPKVTVVCFGEIWESPCEQSVSFRRQIEDEFRFLNECLRPSHLRHVLLPEKDDARITMTVSAFNPLDGQGFTCPENVPSMALQSRATVTGRNLNAPRETCTIECFEFLQDMGASAHHVHAERLDEGSTSLNYGPALVTRLQRVGHKERGPLPHMFDKHGQIHHSTPLQIVAPRAVDADGRS